MGDLNQEAANAAAGIDLSQFFQVFFEEAGENLESMEQKLLNLDIENPDDEEMNAIFRCAHSVKGGAATFGFSDVAELTHQMETLLDKLRRHELSLTPAMVDVLLASGDALKAQLARHQGNGAEAPDTTELLFSIRNLVEGGAPVVAAPVARPAAPPVAPKAAAPAPAAAAPAAPAKPGLRLLELTVGPMDDVSQADNLVELFKEITDLGTIEPLDAGKAADGMRRFKVTTASTDNDLIDLFSFHVAREQVQLKPLGPGYGFHEGAPGAPKAEAQAAADPGYGFFDDAPGAPAEGAAAAAEPAAAPVAAAPVAAPVKAAARPEKAAAAAESSTLRVSVDKVDQLINLVGELVITQAMLAQNSKGVDAALHQQLASGLADLERNTRDLQEAVMSIRMIPMSLVFNRFPRMLRDLAGKLGKKVELVQVGEATELDKGLVEKITDPLTHLVRNSCDHGIELPAERMAKGKPETGTITLIASHQGGSIVIEVRDDGRGLNREKLIKKARERGIDAPDTMSDQEVYGLIFAPGFSTAEQVTDVSGRGVGMDVVKKNISAMGGRIELESMTGVGTRITVRLPLTLAILDGMSVGVGPETYIIPLGYVMESMQPERGMMKSVSGVERLIQVRGEYLPVICLHEVFHINGAITDWSKGIMVVLEADGQSAALFIDQLIGQHQVVIKSLEANYRRVPGIAGATIMGDGRVALILDVPVLVDMARRVLPAAA